MTTPTHITFAEFLYLLLLTTAGVALSALNVFTIAVGSIMPDIDTAASVAGRAFPFLSTRIERKFGHRTITHSMIFGLILAILLLPLYFLAPDIYICLLAGYVSHPLLDTMTVQGVRLFYPLSSVKCVFPLEVNNPHRYRLQTGSKMDRMLGLFFLAGCIPTFLIAHQGYERFIRSTQKNIESAVRDYNEFSKGHFVFADIIAYDMMTKKRVEGVFEVVGALNSTTILIKDTLGMLHSLGKEYQAEYVAEQVVCQKGGRTITTVRSADMSNQFLSQMLDYLDFRFDSRIFGAVSSSDQFSVPQETGLFTPISGSFNTIKFNHAAYGDIQRLNLENLFVTKGILTIRTVMPLLAAARTDSIDTPIDNSSPVSKRIAPSFAQLSFRVDPKENIEFPHQKGDTIREKAVLIKRNLALFYDQQIELDQQKIAALEEERDLTLAEFDQKLLEARQSVVEDSTNSAHTDELFRQGYTSESALSDPHRKYLDAREAYRHLLLSKQSILNKYSIEVQKLRNEISKLSSKQKAAARGSEIHSTVAGIIEDIRQIYHNNKLQVTFVIRRLPHEPGFEK